MAQKGDNKQNVSDPLSSALQWDSGTAYDLLLSLHAIFRPKNYGIPAPWAAGVRKRLSSQGQSELKEFFSPPFALPAYLPVHLVLEMDPPKSAGRFLAFLETIPDAEFTRRIHVPRPTDETVTLLTERALNSENMTEADVEEYRRGLGRSRAGVIPTAVEVRRLFSDLANSAATKKRWLGVLREYYQAFFAEEEGRAAPVLQRLLEQAKRMSKTTTVPDLLERLSNGFTLSEDIDLNRLVLVPSLWIHPYVVRVELADHELLVVYGAHPVGFRLVPGETVPDDALLVLRALGDATRLRLLRLIAEKPRSLQSLASEVKLSLPTVSHHIRELRGAGLIRLEVGGRGRESKYTVRWPSAERAFNSLEAFVLQGIAQDALD